MEGRGREGRKQSALQVSEKWHCFRQCLESMAVLPGFLTLYCEGSRGEAWKRQAHPIRRTASSKFQWCEKEHRGHRVVTPIVKLRDRQLRR